jgi:two-component system alkaline phosphatase synthesis response regulator PhoP
LRRRFGEEGLSMSTRRETHRVLIVDDDPDVVTLLTDLLEAEGYEVLYARNGIDGLVEGIKRRPVDVVILDVMLPLTDGLTILRLLKATRPEMRIVMLTAKADAGDIAEGFRSGCDAYVTKPFEPRKLVAEVRRLTEPLLHP